MKPGPFTTNVRQQGTAITIDLIGEVNAFAENALTAAYKEAEGLDPAVIVLNFSEVNYINSTGIALIVSILAQARKARRKLVVYGLSEHYVTIFQITRLSDFMAIYSDEASALTAEG
jgi:anti-anti-sigma factor